MNAVLSGIVRRLFGSGRKTPETPQPLGMDFAGGLQASQLLPPKALRAASGRRYNAVVGNGATFIAPVTAYPTTTATFLLFNGEAAGGRSYFIDTAYAFLASGTNGAGGALLGAVTIGSQAAANSGANPAAYSSTVVTSLSGKTGGTKAVLANAWTIVGGTPAWQVLAGSAAPAAATIGANVLLANVDGGIVVPPGFGLALTVLSGTGTTALYGVGVTWDELEADLE